MMTTLRDHDDHRKWRDRRLAWLFLELLLVCGALPAAVTGCAGTGGGTLLSGSTSELPTAQDDSPERKRARIRLELAANYYQAGKNGVALDEVKRVMQIDQNFSDAYNLAGLIYQALEQSDLAEQHFRRAIALNPRDGNARHNLGWLQCDQKRYMQADQSFNQALATPGYTTRAKTLLTQGICQVWAGNVTLGIDTLKRSYAMDRSNPATAYNLAQFLFNSHHYDDARVYIRRLNDSDLANAQSLWLGIKIENALGNRVTMQQLGDQLQQRFGDSHESTLYQRRAFNE